MSKGKYKRKRERAQQHTDKKTPETRTLKSEIRTTEDQAEHPTARQYKPEKQEDTSMKFWAWAKQTSLTDRIVAFFTAVLALASIYQFIIMGGQLDTMRKDQRPWIKITATPGAFSSDGGRIGATIHITNSGKTPARGVVRGDFFVEKVKNGESPKLDYPNPHTRFTTGLIVPNDTPVDMFIERLRPTAKNTTESDPVIGAEFDDFKQMNIFFVLYGTVRYGDFFGIDHWTKFCAVLVPPQPPPNSTNTGQPCTNYSDVDSN